MIVARRREARPARSDSRMAHSVSLTLSVLLALVACAAVGVGTFAWLMPRTPRLEIVAGRTVPLGASPWFDTGSLLFAVPEENPASSPPRTADWGCVLRRAETTRSLTVPADPDVVGSRVVARRSVVPVLVIGPARAGDTLRCAGPAARASAGMWSLPANPGVPRVPVSLVVVGIALAGGAALVHPRSRGIEPFGR